MLRRGNGKGAAMDNLIWGAFGAGGALLLAELARRRYGWITVSGLFTVIAAMGLGYGIAGEGNAHMVGASVGVLALAGYDFLRRVVVLIMKAEAFDAGQRGEQCPTDKSPGAEQ